MSTWAPASMHESVNVQCSDPVSARHVCVARLQNESAGHPAVVPGVQAAGPASAITGAPSGVGAAESGLASGIGVTDASAAGAATSGADGAVSGAFIVPSA